MREYFCGGCGLFHWVEHPREETVTAQYLAYNCCSNSECISHQKSNVPIFAVDTMVYAYFAQSSVDFVESINWSSPKYAPAEAIDIYKKQGVPIYD